MSFDKNEYSIAKEYFITFRQFENDFLNSKINFSQEEFSSEDPANPCANYPTEKYSSYAECDDAFVRRYLPHGLKPFWSLDDVNEAKNVMSVARIDWDHTVYGI